MGHKHKPNVKSTRDKGTRHHQEPCFVSTCLIGSSYIDDNTTLFIHTLKTDPFSC
jgi:hypothetical protein